jgi:hypothetical protein
MRIVRSVALAIIAILGLLAGSATVALADDGHAKGHGSGPLVGGGGTGTTAESPGDTGDVPPGP